MIFSSNGSGTSASVKNNLYTRFSQMITQPAYGGAPTKPNAISSNWNSYRRLLQYHQQGYANIGFLHPLLLQHRTASPTMNSFRKLAVFSANDYRGLPAQRTLYKWRITAQTAHINGGRNMLEQWRSWSTSLASWAMKKYISSNNGFTSGESIATHHTPLPCPQKMISMCPQLRNSFLVPS